MANSLLEREAILTAVARHGASARDARGRWLLLRGGPGMGLTSCVEGALRQERATGGIRVRHARSVPQEAEYPFGVLRQLFPEEDAALPFTDGPRAGSRQPLFHRLTTRLAGGPPVLLAVEDLQHTDEASWRWLGYLTRRLGRLPVLLLLTSAPSFDTGELFRATGQETTLPPLSDPAVEQLAAVHGHGRTTARLCAEASAGNPRLLHALLADLPVQGAPRTLDELVDTRYRDAMAQLLDSDPSPARRATALALALCAAAEEASPSGTPPLMDPDGEAPLLPPDGEAPLLPPDGETPLLLAGIAGADPAFLAGVTGLTRERQRGVLRAMPRLARLLSHPLPREAVLANARDGELAPLRLRAARQLYEGGAPAPAVAAHLVGLPEITEEWMTRILEEAAELELGQGRPERAVPLLRSASTGPLAEGRRTALACRLASLELFSSAVASTRRLHRELQLTSGPQRLWVASALCGALVAQGCIGPAMRVLKEATDPYEDSRLTRTTRVVAAAIGVHDPEELPRSLIALRTRPEDSPASAAAPEHSPDAPSESAEALADSLVALYEAGSGEVSAHESTARVLDLLAAPLHPRLRTSLFSVSACLLQWADHPADARDLARRALPHPPALPDLTDFGQQQLILARGKASLSTGRFQQVIDENEPILRACADQGIQLPHVVAALAIAHGELDQGDTAQRLLSESAAWEFNGSWSWDELLYVRGRLHSFDGRWEQALDDYLACGARKRKRGFESPIAQPWRSGAAQALTALGRPVEAVRFADEELRHARAWGTPRVIGRALHLRAVAIGGRLGLETLDEAVALLRSAPAPVELTEALLDLGRARIAAGHGRKGREALREARRLAQRPSGELPRGPLAERTGAHRPDSGEGETDTTEPVSGKPDGADADGRVGTAGDPSGRVGTAGDPSLPRLFRAAGHALALAGARGVGRAPATDAASPLTDAEQRIVDLAVRGLTNHQIGESLHLARRTVETHLTHAYRKLGISRRTQLAARLRSGEPGGPWSGEV
ncbi:helix-turn-helix transcriptional regulator [Streptomyces jumonjinensis]|uniref:helix-turn-helix transcriptional regulator n=1 Tax=Streptomyces jumonjinensis TaxID=1945 RepID=UPI003790C5CD